MYKLIRSMIFQLSAETAHDVTMDLFSVAQRLRISDILPIKRVNDPVDLLGLRFPNKIGLAAGLDKNADAFETLGALGFGHVEVGTVTPRAQPGNPGPRMFRLLESQGIINRMGFNNHGVDYMVKRLEKRRFDGVLGVNIGKNKDTSAEDAVNDYLHCLEKVTEYADYVAVNLSSPNTPGLRDLQFGEPLKQLVGALVERKAQLLSNTNRSVPLFVKIAPDMSDEDLEATATTLLEAGVDGIIATNTTVSREMVQGQKHADETGGLSGAPLFDLSTEKLARLSEVVAGRVPLIGVGGVGSGDDALAKVKAGASLVQIYSGFIYEGPKLIADCAKALKD